jgi:hypothetical protein
LSLNLALATQENAAVQQADEELLIWTDDDVIVSKDGRTKNCCEISGSNPMQKEQLVFSTIGTCELSTRNWNR